MLKRVPQLQITPESFRHSKIKAEVIVSTIKANTNIDNT